MEYRCVLQIIFTSMSYVIVLLVQRVLLHVYVFSV